jgi:hypothetical protein
MKNLYTIAGLVLLGTQVYGDELEPEYILRLNNAIDNQNSAQVKELASIMTLTSEQKRSATKVAQKWVRSYEQKAMNSYQMGNDIAKSHGGPLLTLLGGLGAVVAAHAHEFVDLSDQWQKRAQLSKGVLGAVAGVGLGLTATSLTSDRNRTIAKWIIGPVITTLGVVGTTAGFVGGCLALNDGDQSNAVKFSEGIAAASLVVTGLGVWLTASVWGKSQAYAHLLKSRRILAAVKNIPASDKDNGKALSQYEGERLQA